MSSRKSPDHTASSCAAAVRCVPSPCTYPAARLIQVTFAVVGWLGDIPQWCFWSREDDQQNPGMKGRPGVPEGGVQRARERDCWSLVLVPRLCSSSRTVPSLGTWTWWKSHKPRRTSGEPRIVFSWRAGRPWLAWLLEQHPIGLGHVNVTHSYIKKKSFHDYLLFVGNSSVRQQFSGIEDSEYFRQLIQF